MATVSRKHSPEQPPTAPTTQRKAAPWGYFFYCELLKIFFLLFGNTCSATYAPTILASYAAYGAFVVAFTTFSISIANERSLGWNKLLRTTSMSSALYLGSKFMVIILTGVISLLLLFAVAAISGKVHMDLVIWAQLLGTMVIGMIPSPQGSSYRCRSCPISYKRSPPTCLPINWASSPGSPLAARITAITSPYGCICPSCSPMPQSSQCWPAGLTSATKIKTSLDAVRPVSASQ